MWENGVGGNERGGQKDRKRWNLAFISFYFSIDDSFVSLPLEVIQPCFRGHFLKLKEEHSGDNISTELLQLCLSSVTTPEIRSGTSHLDHDLLPKATSLHEAEHSSERRWAGPFATLASPARPVVSGWCDANQRHSCLNMGWDLGGDGGRCAAMPRRCVLRASCPPSVNISDTHAQTLTTGS